MFPTKKLYRSFAVYTSPATDRAVHDSWRAILKDENEDIERQLESTPARSKAND